MFRHSGMHSKEPIETSGETSPADGGSLYVPPSASRCAGKYSVRRCVTCKNYSHVRYHRKRRNPRRDNWDMRT